MLSPDPKRKASGLGMNNRKPYAVLGTVCRLLKVPNERLDPAGKKQAALQKLVVEAIGNRADAQHPDFQAFLTEAAKLDVPRKGRPSRGTPSQGDDDYRKALLAVEKLLKQEKAQAKEEAKPGRGTMTCEASTPSTPADAMGSHITTHSGQPTAPAGPTQNRAARSVGSSAQVSKRLKLDDPTGATQRTSTPKKMEVLQGQVHVLQNQVQMLQSAVFGGVPGASGSTRGYPAVGMAGGEPLGGGMPGMGPSNPQAPGPSDAARHPPFSKMLQSWMMEEGMLRGHPAEDMPGGDVDAPERDMRDRMLEKLTELEGQGQGGAVGTPEMTMGPGSPPVSGMWGGASHDATTWMNGTPGIPGGSQMPDAAAEAALIDIDDLVGGGGLALSDDGKDLPPIDQAQPRENY